MVLDMCANHPWWLWGLFVLFVCFLLWLDLAIFHRKTHQVSIKEALMWAGIWFLLAMAFNLVVWWQCGAVKGLQFFTGYIIEKSLSVDNLFVILMIFTAFSIPGKFQHRVLFWGIVGALVLRGLLIILGAALIARFEWVFYLFGIFLVYTGIKMLFHDDEEFDPHKSRVVRWVHSVVPVSRKLDGQKFFTRVGARRGITMLFMALIVVEFTDVIFALDSIPAIFAITTDPFIVFTSNVFAILGLRSLYFVVAKAHDLFSHLKTGLAIILIFIGCKLLVKQFFHIGEVVSLVLVLAVLAISILVSVAENKRGRKKTNSKTKRVGKRAAKSAAEKKKR
jgi:tellurite resistance protein TerC